MAFELRDGQGTIFPNRKQNENQPDFRGEIKINGHVWALSLWCKQGKNGEYFSVAASEPRPKPAPGGQQQSPPAERPRSALLPPKPRELPPGPSEPPYDQNDLPAMREEEIPF